MDINGRNEYCKITVKGGDGCVGWEGVRGEVRRVRKQRDGEM